MKSTSFALFVLLCAAATVPPSASAAPRESGVSLAALLQLQAAQSERLARLSNDWSARRHAQQSKIALNQSQLAPVAQGAAGDARRAARLGRDIETARRKMDSDWVSTRAKARQILSPVQRAQLDSLSGDPRYRLRSDSFYQLLVAPVLVAPDAGLNAPQNQDDAARRNWLDARRRAGFADSTPARGTASYGVYGGYSYGGPNLGVYGGYHQGPVGVHAGVGLGGPSIGVSIGRVFGVGRR